MKNRSRFYLIAILFILGSHSWAQNCQVEIRENGSLSEVVDFGQDATDARTCFDSIRVESVFFELKMRKLLSTGPDPDYRQINGLTTVMRYRVGQATFRDSKKGNIQCPVYFHPDAFARLPDGFFQLLMSGEENDILMESENLLRKYYQVPLLNSSIDSLVQIQCEHWPNS